MAKESTKATLLEAGRQIFLERGYNNAGIEAVLQAANIPKGSFYYYFESKEDFGLQVLDRFAECFRVDLDEFLNDRSLTPLNRLRRYVDSRLERLKSQECRKGCLIGNLSQEMADQSEAFRARLTQIFKSACERIAQCLGEAQEAGEIPRHLDVQVLAEFWLNSWQGAILRAKTIRSIAPLETFQKVMFQLVLES